MAANQKHTFFGGAAVLMAGVIIVKVIGAIYKIPLMNILGTVGFAHFSVAYVIFNLLMTIATAGLPVAVSKTIAEADALERHNQVQKIFRVSLITFLILGTAGFLIMFLGARPLADWQHDDGAVYAIMALAPCGLFVCAMAPFRGYAQGHGNMTPTSVSQIVEAVLKLAVGVGLALYIMSIPFASGGEQLEVAAAGAILGVTIGALGGFIYLVIWFVRSGQHRLKGADRAGSSGSIMGQLLRIAIPITIGSAAVSIMSMVDSGQVLGILKEGLGMVDEAAEDLYGTYQGCMNLYNLPSSLMVPFTASIIPAVSAAIARGDRVGSGRVSESALRVAAILALPMGIGLCVVAGPIVALLYPKVDVAVGGPILAFLGIAAICVCIMLICNSILQANGYVYVPIVTTVIGAVVKIAANQLLVSNPGINIYGAAVSTLLCFGTVAVLDMLVIAWRVPSAPNFLRAFAKPLAASVVMGAAAWAAAGLSQRFVSLRLSSIVGIFVGGVVYVLLVIFLRVFSKEDLALMPKGDKLAKIFRVK